MKNLRYITTIFFIYAIAFSMPSFASGNKIVLASDDWCPYVCDAKTDKPGFMVELARQAFALHGIEVEYKAMPLYQAIQAASRGEVDGVLAIARRENKLVYPSQPQMFSHKKAFIRNNDYWRYDAPNALKGRKLCSVLDYTMDSHTRKYFTKNYALNPSAFMIEEGEDANITCIQKVVDGKADVYIADRNVVLSYLNRPEDSKLLKEVSVLGAHPQPLFIAFSPKLQNAKEYADKLVSAVESLRVVGDSKEIAVKYGLCDNVDNCSEY